MSGSARPAVIRLGVLGGSNSMVRDGYVPRTVARLEAAGIRVELTNHAVGATNSYGGLATLAKTGFAASIDVLLVEFCLNDTESFARSPGQLTHWARAFEGVLRRARAANNRLVVLPVLLQSRKSAQHPKLSAVHAGIRRIADRYDSPIADIVDYASLQDISLEALYRDGSHYTVPFGVDLIAKIVVEKILTAFETPSGVAPRRLEKAVDPRNYGGAKYTTDLSAYWQGGPGETTRFANTWRDLEALKLRHDQSLSLRLSGRLLMVEFVSTANSPPLRITFGDHEVVQPTSRQTFRRRGYDFLISTLVPVVHGGYDVAGRNLPITIRPDDAAICPPSGGGDGEVMGTFGPPIVQCGEGFHPVGLLYVGDLMTK